MELVLYRTKFYPTHTIGQLYIDGDFFCFTLEDVVREEEGVPVEKWKIKHETAIPMGTYDIKLVHSPKFGVDSPWLQNVPGFTEILIHAGITHKDTSGCILVGYALTPEDIIKPGSTRVCRDDLKQKLRRVLDDGDKISITIVQMPK